MHYRRAIIPGATAFFTVVTDQRQASCVTFKLIDQLASHDLSHRQSQTAP